MTSSRVMLVTSLTVDGAAADARWRHPSRVNIAPPPGGVTSISNINLNLFIRVPLHTPSTKLHDASPEYFHSFVFRSFLPCVFLTTVVIRTTTMINCAVFCSILFIFIKLIQLSDPGCDESIFRVHSSHPPSTQTLLASRSIRFLRSSVEVQCKPRGYHGMFCGIKVKLKSQF